VNVVIDASVAIKWFVQEDLHEWAMRLLDRRHLLYAPDLIVSEMTNIAWKKAIRGEIDRAQAHEIATTIRWGVPILYPSTALNERALQIALALNHPVYDCLYIACAEFIDCGLVTADARLVAAAKKTAFKSLVRYLEE
jgi:predicted nucleic acid-binding protein